MIHVKEIVMLASGEEVTRELDEFVCYKCGARSSDPQRFDQWLHPVHYQAKDGSCRQGYECPKCARYQIRFRFFRKRIGAVSHVMFPGYGWCVKCKTSWALVEGHSTQYTIGCHMFPMCEACWRETEPIDRLPYYLRLWDSWLDGLPDTDKDGLSSTDIVNAVFGEARAYELGMVSERRR